MGALELTAVGTGNASLTVEKEKSSYISLWQLSNFLAYQQGLNVDNIYIHETSWLVHIPCRDLISSLPPGSPVYILHNGCFCTAPSFCGV